MINSSSLKTKKFGGIKSSKNFNTVESSENTESRTFLKKKNKRFKVDNPTIRKKKYDITGQEYLCKICSRHYFSYSSCYVHLITKHCIDRRNVKTYYYRRNKTQAKNIVESIQKGINIKDYKQHLHFFFEKAYNEIFETKRENFSDFIEICLRNYEYDPIFEMTIKFLDNQRNDLQGLEMVKEITNINKMFAVYLIASWNINKFFPLNILKIILLLREFLNFEGSSYIEELNSYKITESKITEKDYCGTFMPLDVPLLIDDFVGCYLKFDDKNFPLNRNLVKIFISDLNTFLIHYKFTKYRIEAVINVECNK